MLDKDQSRDELLLEAGRNNANPTARSFEGIDLGNFVCVLRSHCSGEFLAIADGLTWTEVARKNYLPFEQGAIDGVLVYRERAATFCPDTPQLGISDDEYFWVPRTIARRLTGSIGADYADYGIRKWAIKGRE